jgi:TRAP-type C4-dicarboxylate transport system permease small subunit
MPIINLAEAGGTTTKVDVVGMLTPILNDALTQITGMISSLMPFVVSIALVSAGIYLVKNFIHNGTRSIT